MGPAQHGKQGDHSVFPFLFPLFFSSYGEGDGAGSEGVKGEFDPGAE